MTCDTHVWMELPQADVCADCGDIASDEGGLVVDGELTELGIRVALEEPDRLLAAAAVRHNGDRIEARLDLLVVSAATVVMAASEWGDNQDSLAARRKLLDSARAYNHFTRGP